MRKKSKPGSKQKKSIPKGSVDPIAAAAQGFMRQLYDWSDFETFVSTLYAEDGDVIIERNKIDIDKFGARRETDVKITERRRLHTYVTLVECKRWKDPVSRDRIDVMAASLEALNAQKGVIFTTKGYEDGAEKYAKGKGIDLFIVRDLTDEEWGLPGRHIHVYNQIWTGQFANFGTPNAQLIPLIENFSGGALALNLEITQEGLLDPTFDLFSVKTDQRSTNFVSMLNDGHSLILSALSNSIGLQKNGQEIALLFPASGHFDFSQTDYKQLRLPEGGLNLSQVSFTFIARMDQVEFKFDRARNLDLAVAVEDYLNSRKYLAVKGRGNQKTQLEIMNTSTSSGSEKPLVTGTVFGIITAP